MRKTKLRHHRRKSSSSDDEMMSLGLFTSSSSSSNLSPLALPFTVERSKPHLNQTLEWPNFHSSTPTSQQPQQQQQEQGLLADSIRTATVPYASNTLNWSDDSFYSFTKPTNTPTNHTWSSVNSNVKAVNPPATHLFGVNQPLPPPPPPTTTWSFNTLDDEPSFVPLHFDLFHDYGSSHGNISQSLFGSKHIDGSRGKEDSALFGGVFGDRVARENNVAPSVLGKSHATSFSTTNHGFVSRGFSKEHIVPWNGGSSYIPFDTRSVMYNSTSSHMLPSIPKSSPSVVIKPPGTLSSFSAQGAVSTKSLEISSTSLSDKNNISVSSNLFKQNESHVPVGFEFKASSKLQVPDIKSSEDVKSSANSSENLDHHNPGEDSPCWKGASTHFSLHGSQEPESPQHPIKKQQKNTSEDNLLPETIIGTFDGIMDNGTVENEVNHVKAESLDVNVVVKALSNLSELLLLHCSKNECGLKEQDYKAIDHIITNLNICMSREIQQVDPAQKCTSPQVISSTVLPEAGHLSALHPERNNDHFGKKSEELQNDERSKDYDTVQKIKRVLDENLVCKEDLPSHSLMYKNLWLEAEAELCTLSYRSRFNRAQREISKSKASVPDVSEAFDTKNVSSSNFSPIAPNIPEAAGSKISNTLADNPSPNVDYHINDVDNSVMARFNILKRRGESNPLYMADKELAEVEASGNEIQSSGVAEESHLQHHLGKDFRGNQKMQTSPAIRTEDVEHLVMARWNVLKRRDFADAEVSSKESQSGDIAIRPQFQHQSGKDKEVPSVLMQNQYGFGSYSTSYYASADWEHVLKDEFS